MTDGEDYAGLNSDILTFPINSGNGSKMCSSISIIDDSILEPVQSFSVLISTTDSNVIIRKERLVLSLMDNDGKSYLVYKFSYYYITYFY